MEQKEKEVWKDIPGFEGSYQASNLGNIKSLSRNIQNNGSYYTSKEKILKPGLCNGYYSIATRKDNKSKSYRSHQLVAMAFLNHIPDKELKLVVDHINNIKTDNRLENLQIITHRENSSKDRKKGSSKYVGVFWSNRYKKWISNIQINGKRKHLGYFTCELEASNVYQNKLKEIYDIKEI